MHPDNALAANNCWCLCWYIEKRKSRNQAMAGLVACFGMVDGTALIKVLRWQAVLRRVFWRLPPEGPVALPARVFPVVLF